MNGHIKSAALKIKKWFISISIRQKINTIYIVLITGQLILLTIAANFIFTRSIISKTIKQSYDNSRLVVADIENILNNTESYSNDLIVRINNYFVDDSANSSDEYSTNLLLKKIFRNTLYVYPQIYAAEFLLPGNKVYASDNVLAYDDLNKLENEYSEIALGNNHDTIWMGMRKNAYPTGNNDGYILTMGKKVTNINSGEDIGFLCIMTSENTFSSIYQSMVMGKTGRYFMCDKNGIVVSSENKNEILKPVDDAILKKWILSHNTASEIIKINGKRMLVTTYNFPKLEWQLVGVVPLSEITKDSSDMSLAIIIIGLICMITAAILSNMLSSSITRPLNRLIKEVKELELDNLNVKTEINSEDDIGILTKNYNNMKQRINDLMSNIIIQQEKQRKYELKLLQAQIRPHFLYNALQLIYSMVEMDKKEQAQKATKSLADFYRIALSSGNEIISIEQEIKNVEGYLYIQKIRCNDVFDYTVDIPEELRKYKILKLTLQPIVENSIKHGFTNDFSGANGHINITASKIKDTLVIEISDNGVGMNAEKVQHLFDRENSTESFGLKNIDERIKLFFGHNYGIKVKSEHKKSTNVSIYIPALEDFIDEI